MTSLPSSTGPSFLIGKRPVGGDAPALIVAELSANHGQRKDVALRTIELAAKAGADAIKLQTYTPDTLTLKSSAAPFVVKTKNEWAGRSLYDLYSEAMTPWEWHAELFACAASHGLLCFSTPFDPTAVAFLEKLGAPAHKIASFELNDLPLVEHCARTGKPMIMSTGMASLAQIEAAVSVCHQVGNRQLALLRCVSAYPARPETMDLASLTLMSSFGTVIGLSDHTRDHTVAVAAVALGAKLVEKHFISDRSVGGPDAFFSLEPDEFRTLVATLRTTERSLGRPRFGPSEDEKASTAFRRSLFVSRDIAAGETLTYDNVRSVRPSNGLDPKLLPDVLGRKAARAVSAGEPMSWGVLGERPHAEVALRKATAADSQLLLRLRNDPVTRQMSRNTAEVAPDEHERWLKGALEDPKQTVAIVMHQDTAVGTVRFGATNEGHSEISITIAPEARGRGLAVHALVAADMLARATGVTTLLATIRRDNVASIRSFKLAGYYSFVDASEGFVACERRLVPYGS